MRENETMRKKRENGGIEKFFKWKKRKNGEKMRKNEKKMQKFRKKFKMVKMGKMEKN